jgi:hypothetical protein
MTASRPALSLKKEGGNKAKIIKGFGLPTRMKNAIRTLTRFRSIISNNFKTFYYEKVRKIDNFSREDYEKRRSD